MMRELESLDEQALQEKSSPVEFFPEYQHPDEDDWQPSPRERMRVFEEYDKLTGDFDE
jgi:hypothetical protein